jgi:hypothetical protein
VFPEHVRVPVELLLDGPPGTSASHRRSQQGNRQGTLPTCSKILSATSGRCSLCAPTTPAASFRAAATDRTST